MKKPILPKDKGVYTGEVQQDEHGNFFCGPYLMDYKNVVAGKFKLGDIVNLKTVIANPSDASAGWYPEKSNNFFLANNKPG